MDFGVLKRRFPELDDVRDSGSAGFAQARRRDPQGNAALRSSTASRLAFCCVLASAAPTLPTPLVAFPTPPSACRPRLAFPSRSPASMWTQPTRWLRVQNGASSPPRLQRRTRNRKRSEPFVQPEQRRAHARCQPTLESRCHPACCRPACLMISGVLVRVRLQPRPAFQLRIYPLRTARGAQPWLSLHHRCRQLHLSPSRRSSSHRLLPPRPLRARSRRRQSCSRLCRQCRRASQRS